MQLRSWILLSSLFILYLSSSTATVSELLQPLQDTGVEWDFCVPLSSRYLVTWKINSENDTLTIGVSSTTVGWLAIGFNTRNPIMVETDAMIARFVGEEGQVGDYYISEQMECAGTFGVCQDSSYGGVNNDPLIIQSHRNDTARTTSFVYNRFRVGPDADYDRTVPLDESVYMVWGYGTSDTINQHGSSARGAFSVVMGNPNLPCPNDCSGNGRCGGCCFCFDGWTGEDCSIPKNESQPDQFKYDTDLIVEADYEFSGNLHSDLRLYWNIKYQPDGTETGRPYLDAALSFSASNEGWIGFGFGKHMEPADAIICEVPLDESGHSVSDYTMLERDTEGVLVDSNLKQENGAQGADSILAWTTVNLENQFQCKFRRYFDTQDSLDTVIVNGSMKCIWAFKESYEWDEHSFRDRGRVKINFYTGDIDKETDLWSAHGIIMFISWGVLVPLASVLARHFKFIGHPWFQIHRGVQTAAVLLQIAGFAIAVVGVTANEASHFSEGHRTIGLVIFLVGCIQPFLGQLADFLWSPEREGVPIFPDRVHAFLGWSVIVLSFINIFSGMSRYESPSGLLIAFLVWVVVFIVFAIIVEGLSFAGLMPKHKTS